MKTRVPTRITAPIRRLCNRIHIGVQAQYIEVLAEPHAQLDDCFNTVTNKIETDGGKTRYGWRIWLLPGILVEGEFHAAWESPVGKLLDISPNRLKASQTLFIADPKKQYLGKQVDNVRIALSKKPLVKELIYLQEQRFRVFNEGELAKQIGEVAVPKSKIQPIDTRLREIQIQLGIGI